MPTGLNGVSETPAARICAFELPQGAVTPHRAGRRWNGLSLIRQIAGWRRCEIWVVVPCSVALNLAEER